MFGLFGFDVKSMSDDELLERQNELTRRVVWASRFAGSEVVLQLQKMISQINFERQERTLMIRLAARAAAPAVMVETDPDLARENNKEQEADATRNAPKPTARPRPFAVNRERLTPTSKPVSDDNSPQ